MEHEERNFIEILRRISTIERRINDSIGVRKTMVSSGSPGRSSNDHRLLSNVNSEEYMHLTGTEYRSLLSGSSGVGVTDHGALTGLLNNDHPQYIRHDSSDSVGDMLVAGYTPGMSRLVFFSKSKSEVAEGLLQKIVPSADSERAMALYKSDGETPIFIIDALNSRIGIGVYPQSTLDVAGSIRVDNGGMEFVSDNANPVISSATGLHLSANNSIEFKSQNGDIVFADGTNARSETFATDVYGWSLESSGDAQFKNIKVNKINARIVSTGVEQYVGGRQTMCKSASPLTADFIVPNAGESAVIHVEPFSDYPLIDVFADGDVIRLVHVSIYDGKYNTADCWGTVMANAFVDRSNSQSYVFTRSTSPNSGGAKAGSVIPAGELALDFGVSGDGYIVSTVV